MYVPAAVGFSVIFSATRLFHFAHGTVLMLAAYAAVAADEAGASLPVAVGLSCLVAFSAGVLSELAVYGPLRRRRATTFVLLFSSIALYTILENLVRMAFGSAVRLLPIDGALEPLAWSGRISKLDAAVVMTAVIVVAVVEGLSRASEAGRALRAVALNPMLSASVGIREARVRALAFAIGSVLVAPAAIFYSTYGGARPGMGLNVVLISAIAMIIGGLGSYVGAAIAAVALGLAQSLSLLWVSGLWDLAVAFGLGTVFILVRPEGLAGRRAWAS